MPHPGQQLDGDVLRTTIGVAPSVVDAPTTAKHGGQVRTVEALFAWRHPW